MADATIGIFGGSGFYELLDDAEELEVDTPFGPTSDALTLGRMRGQDVAFLPRHGRDHTLPPHRVPYRANVWAMAQLGVTRLLAPCAVGSLKPDLEPGTFVVLDQFVDRTRGRGDTFHEQAPVTHVSMAEPYCPTLRGLAVDRLAAADRRHRDRGTIVVIDGPRFSTKAESRWFAAAGWDVVGMTQYPEVPLAVEQAMCVLGVAMVTDYDAGLEDEPDIEPVTAVAVLEVFRGNVAHVKALVEEVVAGVPEQRDCGCGDVLDHAEI